MVVSVKAFNSYSIALESKWSKNSSIEIMYLFSEIEG